MKPTNLSNITRRESLKRTAGAFMILPAGLAHGYTANEKLNLGIIGLAGQGERDAKALQAMGENIAALCDVGFRNARPPRPRIPEGEEVHRLPEDDRERKARWRHRRDARPQPRLHQRVGHEARRACLLSEASDADRARSQGHGASGRADESRHADGHFQFLRGPQHADRGIRPVGRAWRHHRGARRNRPPHLAPRLRSRDRRGPRPPHSRLGQVARHRAHAAVQGQVSPGPPRLQSPARQTPPVRLQGCRAQPRSPARRRLPSVRLARLHRVRQRRPRRHRSPQPERALLGSRSRRPLRCRGHRNQRYEARDVPGLDRHAFRMGRARRASAAQALSGTTEANARPPKSPARGGGNRRLPELPPASEADSSGSAPRAACRRAAGHSSIGSPSRS